MKDYIKILTTLAKVLGVLSALDLTPIAPRYGIVIALVASTAKDACNVLVARLSTLPPDTLNKVGVVLVLLIPALGMFGCASRVANGNITSVTQSVIGVDLSQDAASAVPHVRIGFVRSQYHVVPTGSNVYAPAVISSIDLDSSWNHNSVTEDFATGGATRDLAPDSPAKVAAAAKHKPKTNTITVRTNSIPVPK